MLGQDFLQLREKLADTLLARSFVGGYSNGKQPATCGSCTRLLMLNHSHRSRLLLALASLLVIAHTGCVALNIPSRRHHDPGDQGGLFGPWNGNAGSGVSAGHSTSAGIDGPCATCGDSGCQSCMDTERWDECESGCGSHEEVKPPEIPWPKYHPVPTRPVFGAPTAP